MRPESTFVLRDTVINLVGLSVPLVVGVLAIPPTVHALGIDRFGLLAFGWVLVGYAGALDLGVGRASTRAAAQALTADDLDKFARIASSALIFAAVLGIVAAVVFSLSAQLLVRHVLRLPPDLASEAEGLFFVLAAGLPATLSLGAARGVLEAGRRFDYVQFVLVPANVLLYLLPAVGAEGGLSLPMIGVLLITSRIGALLGFLRLWHVAYPSVRFSLGVDMWELRRLVRFGGWLTVSGVVGLLVVYGERSVVGAILAVGALTYYVLAYELAGRLWIIPAALNSALFPLFSSYQQRQSPDLSVLAARMVRYSLLALSVPVLLLIVAGGQLVELWLGPITAEGVRPVVAVFVAGVLLNSVGYVPLVLLQAGGRADLVAKVQMIEVVPSLVVTALLTSQFGLPGSALAWFARVGADTFALFAIAAMLNKSLAISVFRFASLPVAAIAITGLLLNVLGQIFRPIEAALAGLAVFALLLLVSWRYLLDTWDRQLVRAILARRRRDRTPL